MNNGITGGDERFLEKLYDRGMPPLPAPPELGYVLKDGQLIEYA